ncbi:hypothetical protein GCM10028807_45720 [Spirosoma daeguense]
MEVDRERHMFLLILGWALWYIFIMQQITVFNQKERAINYLMQPASQLEKITLLWFISGIGFLAVYLIIFTAFDAIGIAYINNRSWTPEQLDQIRRIGGLFKLNPWYHSSGIESIPVLVWLLTAIFHAVYMMVSFVVRRYTMALGVLLTLAVFLLSIVLNSVFMQLLTGNSIIRTAAPFAQAMVEGPNQSGWRRIDLPQPLGDQIRYTVAAVVAILAYITAYVRLKEREV